ncbi:MAG TPA: cytochrome c biogenesis protein CcdA [Acidimicrobiales bacterium]|nr:cytochrome c biogenesis protein CcdA [Acidimicrobiales bacterium]
MADPSIPAAFGAGVVSFLSPCVLPLVPGYLAMMSGLSGEQLADPQGADQRLVLRTTLLFVAGFSVVFVALGASASAVGDFLFNHKVVFDRVAGVVVVVMGLFLAGVASPSLLEAEKRFHVSPRRLGPYAAPVMGMAFAFGWTPCLGPILAALLVLASNEGTVLKGAALLLVYSLGLGVPFILSGIGLARLEGTFRWVKRHYRLLNGVAGALLVVFGVLLFTNRLTLIASDLVNFFDTHGLGWVIR